MSTFPINPAAAAPIWRCGAWTIDLSVPRIMGIVNVTPDSFSDAGHCFDGDLAIRHAQALIEEGAAIIDIGGESTRPNAPQVDAAEERSRVLPVIRALRDAGVPLSIDTSKPEIMQAALDAGACIVNDVYALRQRGALDTVARSDCGVVLMHMQGVPRTMQAAPSYQDVVAEVSDFLGERRRALRDAGVTDDRIVVDPGFGFGKTAAHNWRLLAGLGSIDSGALPLLAGLSRKSMLGHATGRPVEQRLPASVAAAVLALERGVRVLRVHDVAATRDAVAVWCAMHEQQNIKGIAG
jgi:dihydropteroate synthase